MNNATKAGRRHMCTGIYIRGISLTPSFAGEEFLIQNGRGT